MISLPETSSPVIGAATSPSPLPCISLIDAVNAAIESTRPLFQYLAHDLDTSFPAEPLYLEADATSITQIVANLLTNAAKFTEPPGHITLTVRAAAGWTTIRVSDPGWGIPPEQLPHIFTIPTPQKNSNESPRLGLRLVRHLTTLHRGTVEAFSKGPGRGSEFVVHLPLASPPKPASQATRPSEKSAPIPPKRILAVDDNLDAIKILKALLTRDQHTVETAHNGRTALEIAETFQPEIALLDIGLPDMQGYELARVLRVKWPEIILIAITGWGQAGDRRRSREAGFDFHLVKPVELEELRHHLHSAANKAE